MSAPGGESATVPTPGAGRRAAPERPPVVPRSGNAPDLPGAPVSGTPATGPTPPAGRRGTPAGRGAA
ncbi:hypothetical protein EAD96_01645, partial [Micromonospora sp. BL1]